MFPLAGLGYGAGNALRTCRSPARNYSRTSARFRAARLGCSGASSARCTEGLGISVAIQTALNRVWPVPQYARLDPVLSRLRAADVGAFLIR
jgi:hypothetical protein